MQIRRLFSKLTLIALAVTSSFSAHAGFRVEMEAAGNSALIYNEKGDLLAGPVKNFFQHTSNDNLIAYTVEFTPRTGGTVHILAEDGSKPIDAIPGVMSFYLNKNFITYFDNLGRFYILTTTGVKVAGPLANVFTHVVSEMFVAYTSSFNPFTGGTIYVVGKDSAQLTQAMPFVMNFTFLKVAADDYFLTYLTMDKGLVKTRLKAAAKKQ